MGPQISSIDTAAAGSVRLKAARTLLASGFIWVFLGAFLPLPDIVMAMEPMVTAGEQPDAVDTWISRTCAFLCALPILLLTSVLLLVASVGVSWVVDRVPRRLVALVAAPALAGMGLIGLAVTARAALELAGVFGNAVAVPAWGLRMLSVWGVMVMGLCLSGLLLYGWQLLASDERFEAARGYRPAASEFRANVGRALGLPAFVAQSGEAGRELLVSYVLVAILNAGPLALLIVPLFAPFVPTVGSSVSVVVLLLFSSTMLAAHVLGVGRGLARFAERQAIRAYQHVREWDERRPVVFLRAFDQDAARLGPGLADPMALWPVGVGRSRTLDEVLLEHASPRGPLLAIGDPRDPTPPLGAARLYVHGDDDAWQAVVTQLVRASALVVLCPNESAGVRWELELLASEGDRVRVLYLANPELPGDANLELLEGIVGERLPVAGRQQPVAAFLDAQGGWQLLTAKRLSYPAYATALNLALRRMAVSTPPSAPDAPRHRP
ncbi:MAG: hypothetical protein KTR31_10820 [Myxococcales bacterium]|nr:hypothetical protein [Myxococcales bacterium]